MLGVAFLVTAVAIIGIWILIEFKRMRHKVFAMFLIFMILFSYVSVTYVFSNKEVDLNTLPGVVSAAKMYYSWLAGVFVNVKTITANAIRMDWGRNESSVK
jgi:hypothetical protein